MLLHLQKRLDGLHFRAVEFTSCGGIEFLHHGVRQLAGQGHSSAIPAWHGGFLASGALDVGGHVFHPYQLQQTPAEQKAVAGLEPGDEAFLDAAQRAATAAFFPVFEVDGGFTDDGADAHTVPTGQTRIGNTPDTVFIGFGAAVIGVSGQRVTAVAHERQRPMPLFIAEVAVGPGAAHFHQQLVGQKTAAQRHADQVLHQHIKWLVGGFTRLDHSGGHGIVCGGGFDQFQAVGRH
ncbi:hypothetical protein ALP75_200585 [Pseudomonas syringae pv. actinidiae]|nr:hypothetical protein ALP75_200585 [Pseudomonas syringae pv. actinidiae]